MPLIRCVKCEKERESPLSKSGVPRVPRRWKDIGGKVYCPDCKLALYALRAVTIPVAQCDWDKIGPLTRTASRDVTKCANWLMTRYFVGDTLSVPSEKLPKWTPPYVYNEARGIFPAIEPTAMVSLINTAQAKYRAMRFDMWRGVASLPTFRDLPVPLNSQAYRIVQESRLAFEFRFNGEWHSLVLRSGGEFRRQLRQIAQMESGDAESGEAALYWRDKTLMLKIAGWFPREVANGTGIIKARTVADGFISAVSNTGAIWRLNADHVQRWIIGGKQQQQRLREDLKAERRFPKEMREGIIARMGQLAELRGNRMDSWMHEAAMQLVNWAKRQKAASLCWDDSFRSGFPEFPWFVFAQRIQQKCEMAGMEFVSASDGAALQIQV